MEIADVVTVVIVVAFAASVQSITGFAFALLSVPLLSFAIPVDWAVVIAASLGAASSAVQAVGERRDGDRPTIVRMLIGAALGSPFGLVILVVTTDRQLRAVLAVVIISFLILNLRGVTLTRGGPAVDVGAGLMSGVLNTSLSTNGPPLVMALHARHLQPAQFRGTISAVFVGSGLVTVALFAAAGRYEPDVLRLLAVAVPATVIGYAAGARVRGRVPPARFRQLVMALLTATAVTTVVGVIVG